MTIARDNDLGAALRSLETPDHGIHFHADLHRRLAEERARPPRLQRLRWPLRLLAIAAAVAVAAVGFQLLRSWSSDSASGGEPVSAAAVKAAVREAFAGSRALSGTFVSRRGDPASEKTETASGTFLFLADGSFLVRTDGVAEAYDARRRIRTLYDPNPGFEPVANRARRLAAGPPDAAVDSAFQQELRAVVNVLLGVASPPVEREVLAGRPVWTLSAPVGEESGGGSAPDRVTVSVDRATGIPLYASWTVGGEVVRELTLSDVVVDPAVSLTDVAVEIPENVAVSRSNRRFDRVELDEVAAAVGYAPLVPGRLPAGYELTEVTVATRAGRTGVDGENPLSRGVVSLAYRQGLDRVVVTTRLAGEGTWSDPLATARAAPRPEGVQLERGALSGVEASLLIGPLAIPHLWARTDELVVTVAGDLDREGLLRVAESLEAQA
jgi:hypothetical protein